MNKLFLYTIYKRVEDLVRNPEWEETKKNLEHELEQLKQDEEAVETYKGILNDIEEFIPDPRNPSGVRYEEIKITHDLNVAQSVCASESGEYVYTHTEAWHGENY